MVRTNTSATQHLARVDPVMCRLSREVGPVTLVPRSRWSPFESLARAIAYQQLHDKAAESLLARRKPYRTAASWHLWRTADRAKQDVKVR